jgi:hypothetical protein
MSGCKCKPDVKRKRGSAAASRDGAAINNMSGCECKPDAKRKRGSAQPQGMAQPSTE